MEQILFAVIFYVLLQQLVNIPFRYWTSQHTVVWAFVSGSISPTDEYYWEYGVKLDDICHRVKHLRRNKMWALVNIMNEESACWTIFFNLSTYIIWSLSRAQGILGGALDEPDFYIVNLLLVIHSQHQGLTVGVDGAVSYQKCPVLKWEKQKKFSFRHIIGY